MMKKLMAFAVLASLIVISLPQTSQALTCATWKDAEKSIRTWWGQAYPKEKILSIEQGGPPETYSKTQSTNQKKIDEYGNEWEYYKKNPYCSIPAKVKVQQSSGKRVFNVSAVYKVSGKKFTFDDLAVGSSQAQVELAPGEVAQPDAPEIKKVIQEHFMSMIPPDLRENIQVESVLISKNRPLVRWDDGQAFYSIPGITFNFIEDGEKKTCEENVPTALYKGEEKNRRLNAAGPWKIVFGDKHLPKQCVTFAKYYSRVDKYIDSLEGNGPPPKASSSKKAVKQPADNPEQKPEKATNDMPAPNLKNMMKGFGF
jgi:hypothetical protein